MTRPDVPEKDRLAEAVVRSLCEGAGTSDGAAAIVKPISLDVPVGNLSHEDSKSKNPIWVKEYYKFGSRIVPFVTSKRPLPMSALGQKRISRHIRRMSALPRKQTFVGASGMSALCHIRT